MHSLSSDLSCCTMNCSVSFSRGRCFCMLPLQRGKSALLPSSSLHLTLSLPSQRSKIPHLLPSPSLLRAPSPPVNGGTDGDRCPLVLVDLGQSPHLGHEGHLGAGSRHLHVLTEQLRHEGGRLQLGRLRGYGDLLLFFIHSQYIAGVLCLNGNCSCLGGAPTLT